MTTVLKYNQFLERNNPKTEGDKFIQYLHKNKYFEIPFISKTQFSAEDFRKDIPGALNSVIFDTSFQKPLGISWIKVEPYLSTFQGIEDQIKGIVRLTFSDNSKKIFAVTIDGISKSKIWYPEMLRIQNHNIESTKNEGFDITDRSTQIYGTSNPDSVTPEPTDRPAKKLKRLIDMGKDKLKKLKQIGTGNNRPEDSSEPTN